MSDRFVINANNFVDTEAGSGFITKEDFVNLGNRLHAENVALQRSNSSLTSDNDQLRHRVDTLRSGQRRRWPAFVLGFALAAFIGWLWDRGYIESLWDKVYGWLRSAWDWLWNISEVVGNVGVAVVGFAIVLTVIAGVLWLLWRIIRNTGLGRGIRSILSAFWHGLLTRVGNIFRRTPSTTP